MFQKREWELERVCSISVFMAVVNNIDTIIFYRSDFCRYAVVCRTNMFMPFTIPF